MVGGSVEECKKAWLAWKPSLRAKALCVDLREVLFVDERGLQLLREIHEATSAEFLTSTPLTAYFAEQAVRRAAKNGKGE